MLRSVPVAPQDVLDAGGTIPPGDTSTCNWLAHWASPATTGEWARRGLAEGDAYGLSNAITYAKRAAACRIDVLVQYNHLTRLARLNYPSKVAGLREIGLAVPDVVQELVIDPRNNLEHEYHVPDRDVARHAVEVSDLFLRATQDEYQRGSVVAVGWNAMGSHSVADGREVIVFSGFTNRPMLFVDVFDDPAMAKIVDPAAMEVRLAELRSFTEEEAVALATLLRRGYSSTGSRSIDGRGPRYYREMKRQAGF